MVLASRLEGFGDVHRDPRVERLLQAAVAARAYTTVGGHTPHVAGGGTPPGCRGGFSQVVAGGRNTKYMA